jgi:dephospho-CoA kinase
MIIGVTGTLGAGKGTVVEYLRQTRMFMHYSARSFLLEEVERLNLPPVRDSLNIVGDDLRKRYGPSYVVEQLFQRATRIGGNAVIESLHTVGEAEYLKSQGALIIGVDADIHTRYERILKRKSMTDHITFEKFQEDNEKEIASDDPTKHNIRGVIDCADLKIMNDGTAEELCAKVEKFLTERMKSVETQNT